MVTWGQGDCQDRLEAGCHSSPVCVSTCHHLFSPVFSLFHYNQSHFPRDVARNTWLVVCARCSVAHFLFFCFFLYIRSILSKKSGHPSRVFLTAHGLSARQCYIGVKNGDKSR